MSKVSSATFGHLGGSRHRDESSGGVAYKTIVGVSPRLAGCSALTGSANDIDQTSVTLAVECDGPSSLTVVGTLSEKS